jgi:iron complex outermembrane receptor protein
MKKSLLASAVLTSLVSSYAIAAPVSGVVLDNNNQPISNVRIHYHGKKTKCINK